MYKYSDSDKDFKDFSCGDTAKSRTKTEHNLEDEQMFEGSKSKGDCVPEELFGKRFESCDHETRAGSATIFDLCPEHRQRVQAMITELMKATEMVETLEDEKAVLAKSEEKYKKKCNFFMKRVDILSENCDKLKTEKAELKEAHVKSLTSLRTQVTDISKSFESSEKEMQMLTDRNEELESENKKLIAKIRSLEGRLEKERPPESVVSFSEMNDSVQKLIELHKSKKQISSESSRQELIGSSSSSTDLQKSEEGKSRAKFNHHKEKVTEDKLLEDLFFRF